MNKLSLILLLIVWMIGSSWYYVCKIKEQCPGKVNETSITTNLAGESAQPKWPLYFLFSSLDPNENPGFEKWRDSIVQLAGGEKEMYITGLYSPDETFSRNYNDPGMERAKMVQKVLFGDTSKRDNIFLESRRMNGMVDSVTEGKLFNIQIKDKEQLVVEEVGRMTIYFPKNSSEVLQAEEVRQFLDRFAASLKANNQKLVIEGNADNSGTSEINNRLGMERAQAVMNMLVDRGISPVTMTAVSRGDTQPVGDNNTEEGRSRNRRVELIVK